ncbi:MAG: protein-(glutamine-N5) methyltransferase, release factor-specific [Rhodospirillaceae bacterium]|nr:protein-(glutamine-N5) methyltransferase, release factor-specific [Magnetovibrio sp.]MAY68122.1 protein-(glutamine-N5) methyltransferase, release factor-specific [Rhodospirillaceae bacterium]
MTQRPSRFAPGTLGHAVDQGAADLAAAGIDTARLDARVLTAHVLGREASFVLTHPDAVLSAAEQDAARRLIARRAAHEPVSRILGEKEFWSLAFRVTEATLTPRPETETLVEDALARIRENGREGEALRLLDLGTGTGCLLLAVMSELPRATGLGIDISAEAVAVAADNARKLGLDDRARFQVGDWAAGLAGPFDVILSNPPYIAEADRGMLPPEVLGFDPHGALFAGARGLDAYAAIAPQAARLLAPDGIVLVELGRGQDADVAAIFRRAGLVPDGTRADLAGILRSFAAVTGTR